jgi:hypothetical protein
MLKRLIAWLDGICFHCGRDLIEWGHSAPSGRIWCPVCDLHLADDYYETGRLLVE